MNSTKFSSEARMVQHLCRYVSRHEILFATGQGLAQGHDHDIYCVVAGPMVSRVHIYREKGDRYEIFIDDWETLQRKLTNSDEIAANFIRELQPLRGLGCPTYLRRAPARIPKRFALPHARRDLTFYRLLVLHGKFLEAKPREKSLFWGQMLLPLFMLTFDALGHWPPGPKKWVHALQSTKALPAKRLLTALTNEKAFNRLVKSYLAKASDLHLVKSGHEAITFLG